VSDQSKTSDDSVGDVGDVVVSAPDAVVVMVILVVAGDGVSISRRLIVTGKIVVEGSVVVEERQALSVPCGSKDDVDNAESDETETQDGEEERMSSGPSEETDKTKS